MVTYHYQGLSLSSGVYIIFNNQNWKVYIGSTSEFKNRWTCGHVSKLKHQRHPNPYLQAAWNKHGEDAFEFHVVENMPGSTREERLRREDEWLEIHWGKGKCYNTRRKANAPKETHVSGMKGKKHTELTKQKMSKVRLGKKLPPHSVAAKEKNRLSNLRDRCWRGHIFAEVGLYIAPKTGIRNCKACQKIRASEYQLRNQ